MQEEPDTPSSLTGESRIVRDRREQPRSALIAPAVVEACAGGRAEFSSRRDAGLAARTNRAAGASTVIHVCDAYVLDNCSMVARLWRLCRSSSAGPLRDLRDAGERITDLRDHLDLTYRLLDDTRTWRERVVHKFALGDVDHVQASTTYQLRLPADVVEGFAPEAGRGAVRLLLPLTVRPKQLLLGLDFSGPIRGECSLLLREQIASIQAGYVSRQLEKGSGGAPELEAAWYGISAFTVDAWRHHLALQQRMLRACVTQKERALVNYLNSDLDLGIARTDVQRWIDKLRGPEQLLVAALEEGEDPDSPAELLLLAIPFMPYRPASTAAIDRLVDDFVRCVGRMTQEERALVAEYGRRWEVLVDVVTGRGTSLDYYAGSATMDWVALTCLAGNDRLRRRENNSHRDTSH